MKKLKSSFIPLILLTFLWISAKETTQPKNLYLPESLEFKEGKIVKKADGSRIKLNKDTTEIAWDLDDTLAEPSWQEAMKLMASYQGARLAISYAVSYLIQNQVAQAFENIKKSKREVSAESLAEQLSEIDPQLSKLILDLGNIINPKDKMLNLIRYLKKLGFEQIIATNKELPLFRRALEKKSMQELFELLPKALIFSQEGQETELIKFSQFKKPYDTYYQRFEQEFNPEKKWILFIDDNQKNITGSPEKENQTGAVNNAGWISLKFESPEQLKDDLTALGILD